MNPTNVGGGTQTDQAPDRRATESCRPDPGTKRRSSGTRNRAGNTRAGNTSRLGWVKPTRSNTASNAITPAKVNSVNANSIDQPNTHFAPLGLAYFDSRRRFFGGTKRERSGIESTGGTRRSAQAIWDGLNPLLRTQDHVDFERVSPRQTICTMSRISRLQVWFGVGVLHN